MERAAALQFLRGALEKSSLGQGLIILAGHFLDQLCPLEDWFGEGSGGQFRQLVEQYERRLMERALARTGGNKQRAAWLLGLKRTTLVEKLKRWKDAGLLFPGPDESNPTL
jgi:transcriptional regulator of acetoin/glycerol metabolism